MAENKNYNHKISEEEMFELEEQFHLFDKENTGYITTVVLGRVMRLLGQNPTESEIQDMIVRYDTDGNGVLDFEEFCSMMIIMKQVTNNDDELMMAFKFFDKNNTGSISLEDLRDVLYNLGEHFTDEYIEDIFKEVDSNGDGVISYEDFILVMK